ncbi:PatA/PatG family cyanobactin maturation protease [Vibrio nigripulchritudo]|uniref:PatA/PatG family cyanobactin maturation protease n=1 Tax=Vibrio nigripulchritudo TaxID=28173 RepID=UPI0003B1CFC0|nr:PatA/PatG family cyanobactin maturation protease [Vibrio nigripulchritudo]CCN73594.1 Peptidase S8 and S53 subtilisin kexin sedolisin [Vibrio nigripulchritudo SFn118]
MTIPLNQSGNTPHPLEQLQEWGHSGKGIKVAVIDGDIDSRHPLLQHLKIEHANQHEPLGSKHGTAVCSQLAGSGIGVAPEVEIVSIPVFSQTPDGQMKGCSEYQLSKAIRQAVKHQCDVINISGACLSVNGHGSDQLRQAIKACDKAGIKVIAAVGNDGQRSESLPASLPSVLAVGACNKQGEPASFNNHGAKLQKKMLMASGVDMPVALPQQGLSFVNGSSFATPIVTGVYALLLNIVKANKVSVKPDELEKWLFSASTRFSHNEHTYHRLNLAKLMQLVQSQCFKQQNRPNARRNTMTTEKTSHTDAVTPSEYEHSDHERAIPREDEHLLLEEVTPSSTDNSATTNTSGLNLPKISDPAGHISAHNAATAVMPQSEQTDARVVSQLDKVFVIGEIGYDFGSEARLDYFTQVMGGENAHPFDPVHMARHLSTGDNVEQSNALIWTLKIDGIPVFAIEPDNQFAVLQFARLVQFLHDQETQGVERVSIAGVITGETRLFNGQVVPRISPVLRGMFNWTSKALADSVYGENTNSPSGNTESMTVQQSEQMSDFLNRVYYELRNRGEAEEERAINFAATNAFQMKEIFADAFKENLFLNKITADQSPITRPESICLDVVLEFFNPKERLTAARKLYRYTIDVSDVMPVTVGKVRMWHAY